MEACTPPESYKHPPERSFFSNPTIRGLGEHRKLPSGVWSGASATNAFGTFGIRDGSRNLFGGGGQTKVPNRKLRVKPESRARSARVSRAKPESRARSAREFRANLKPRAKPEKKAGGGVWGGGSVSPSPENC